MPSMLSAFIALQPSKNSFLLSKRREISANASHVPSASHLRSDTPQGKSYLNTHGSCQQGGTKHLVTTATGKRRSQKASAGSEHIHNTHTGLAGPPLESEKLCCDGFLPAPYYHTQCLSQKKTNPQTQNLPQKKMLNALENTICSLKHSIQSSLIPYHLCLSAMLWMSCLQGKE